VTGVESPGASSAATLVVELCRNVQEAVAGTPLEARATAISARLNGPLRIAIAGRVKAGKSTLLNALVGERLAPTDAGECTKIVSWYVHGTGYEVAAELKSHTTQPLAFTRQEGALDVELGALTPEQIERLVIQWPSSALQATTLIDTPGLASMNDENSVRTRDFLEATAGHPSDADAVIYLMRHLHKSDVAFLDAFMDRSVSGASPVNAVAVLARADEIGAGRPDALESAARIAARYRADPRVRSLCATVTPMAGLLAETGLTFREDEAASLRMLAETSAEELDRMMLSADHFCDVSASALTAEFRRDLLRRLGMYGVRFALDQIRAGANSAAQLAPLLVQQSGLPELRSIIDRHFLPRARVLQARTALVGLRALAQELRVADPVAASRIDRDGERIEASAVEFAQLRVAHLVLSGVVRVTEEERGEIERVLLAADGASALGLPGDAPVDDRRSLAVSGIERWRTKASDPLADPAFVETCETIARTYEGIYAGTS
jgi:hypothetical protein